MLREKKGVTIVAVVIIIIVVVILAGVSLSALKGENGLINETMKSKETAILSELKEQVNLKLINYKQQNENDFEYYLNQIENVKIEKVNIDTYYVTREGITVTAYENGDMIEGKNVWDGKSQCPIFKGNNWYIYNGSQLKFLEEYVNNGFYLTDTQKELINKSGYDSTNIKITEQTTIYLMNDIDLGAREIDGEWETEENESFKWNPIGKSRTLIATFEGNNHYIRGAYINSSSSNNGIFGISHSIRNLIIKDSYINGASHTGAIVGWLKEGTIENCHNINTKVILREGEYFTMGGVLGYAANGTSVLNCSNKGSIYALGISTSGRTQVGGIVGRLEENAKLDNCYNEGNIGSKGPYIGGVVGVTGTGVTITNSYNTGTIDSQGHHTGGVVGEFVTFSTISNCYNTGEIIGKNNYTGGVVGIMVQSDDVTNSKIEKCYNSGNIYGENNVGGIVGFIAGTNGQGTVTNCYNKGLIGGKANIGSIIGYQVNQSGLNILNNLYYLDTVRVGAVSNIDDSSKNIISTIQDIKSYQEFIQWIENK